MPISTLFSAGLDPFLKAHGDRPQDFWLFQHIPKTAGSAVRNQLFKTLRPSTGIDVRNIDPSLPLDERRDKATGEFLGKLSIRNYRCAGGHISMQHVLRILESRPDAKLITFLRDPVERLLSDYAYFYHERIACENEDRVKKQFASLEGYVHHPSSQNKMFRFLTPDQAMTDQDLLAYMKNRFTFIGLQDRYAESMTLLGRLIGKIFDSETRIRDGEQLGTKKPVINEEDRKLIAAKNRLDVNLYAHFSQMLEPFL